MSGTTANGEADGTTRIRIPYEIKRDAWDQDHFDHIYDYEKSDPIWRKKLQKCHQPTGKTYWRMLTTLIPILDWLPKYKLSYLSTDVIAGATIGVFKIPQAMAYSSLAGVGPEVGLYSSFFPPLIYGFLGTSRHISLGVFAVVSLMLNTAQKEVISDQIARNASSDGPVDILTPIEVVSTLTFVIGLVLILLAVFQLAFVSNYMSDQVVGGFTTASAFHVIASQIDKIIGVDVPETEGLFKLYWTVRDLIGKISETNFAALTMCAICLPCLYIGNQYVNPRVMKMIRVPIPFELISVIIGTVLSHQFHFHDKYTLPVVGGIPYGLPTPKLPKFYIIGACWQQGVFIAIVLYAVTISVAKVFAKKHHYKINPAQELRALGFANLLTSTLSCQGASGSLSRAAVNSALGVHTQLASLVTATMILMVIMWIGPLLEDLPKCILACIIICALQGMLKQFGDLIRLWPISKIDFSIWLVAFVGTIAWDLMQGLVIGVGYALLTVIFRTQWPQMVHLARIPDTDLYRDHERYKTTKVFDDIAILRFDSPLLFTNIEEFKEKVQHLIKQHKKQSGKGGPALKCLIIDGSGFTYIDYMGAGAIGDVYDNLAGRNIQLYMAACKAPVRDLFDSSQMYKRIPKRNFHPSIHDAVLYAMQRNQVENAGKDNPVFTEHL